MSATNSVDTRHVKYFVAVTVISIVVTQHTTHRTVDDCRKVEALYVQHPNDGDEYHITSESIHTYIHITEA